MGRQKLLAIDSPPKRQRLSARANPYWIPVGGGRGGASLGYRRRASGPGSWVAKVVLAGRRIEEKLAQADDVGADADALSYPAAVELTLAWCSRQVETIAAQKDRPERKSPTVKSAVENYIATRIARSAKAGANAAVRLRMHVLRDERFALTALRKLRAKDIEEWRSRLPTAIGTALSQARPSGASAVELIEEKQSHRQIGSSTVNRLLNDLRAALNAAADSHRRELSPHLPAEIRAGTKALSVAANARKQILPDTAVRALVDAAWTVDEDFGPLVLLAAASGARFSQLAAVTVGDFQPARRRVLVPSSRKGRGTKNKPPIAVPLSDGVLARLTPLAKDRLAREPLLTRWAYRHAGGLKWEKHYRRSWSAAYEIEKCWAATVAVANVPADTVMYALRHSSIVRGLCAGLPVRLVAAAHDTSVEMIEAHYSAHILDATEDLHRKHALQLQ